MYTITGVRIAWGGREIESRSVHHRNARQRQCSHNEQILWTRDLGKEKGMTFFNFRPDKDISRKSYSRKNCTGYPSTRLIQRYPPSRIFKWLASITHARVQMTCQTKVSLVKVTKRGEPSDKHNATTPVDIRRWSKTHIRRFRTLHPAFLPRYFKPTGDIATIPPSLFHPPPRTPVIPHHG